MTTTAKRRRYAAVASIGSCVLCGEYGVQVSHSNMERGLGQKSAAHMTAALCTRCHSEIDNGRDLTQQERRGMHNRAIVLTHDRLIRAGKMGLL